MLLKTSSMLFLCEEPHTFLSFRSLQYASARGGRHSASLICCKLTKSVLGWPLCAPQCEVMLTLTDRLWLRPRPSSLPASPVFQCQANVRTVSPSLFPAPSEKALTTCLLRLSLTCFAEITRPLLLPSYIAHNCHTRSQPLPQMTSRAYPVCPPQTTQNHPWAHGNSAYTCVTSKALQHYPQDHGLVW